MLFATSSPYGPIFLAAFTSSLRRQWLSNVATCADGRGGEVQAALWEKASGLRQTPLLHRNPQRSPTRSGRKYRLISQEVLSRTYPVDLGANLLHLAGVTWDSVEPISLEEVLLRFKLLNRFPNKRRDLDGLIGCYLVLGECFLSSQLDKTLIWHLVFKRKQSLKLHGRHEWHGRHE